MKGIEDKRFTSVFFIFLVICPMLILAQEDNPVIQEAIETEKFDVFGFSENQDFSVYEDYYPDLLMHPVNLGKINPLDLLRLTMLDEREVEALYQYILDYGPLVSEYELLMVEGISSVTAAGLSRYCCFDKNNPVIPHIGEIFKKPRAEILITGKRQLQSRKKVLSNYLFEEDTGKLNLYPWQQKVRIRFTSGGHLSAGINLNNEVGDQSLDRLDNFRVHHSPAFIGFDRFGVIKRMIIGDFGLSFGQGLALGAGSSLSLGNETELRTQSRGVFPFLSNDPAAALHGIGLWLQSGQSGSCVFYSDRPSSTEAGLYFYGGGEHWKSGVGLYYQKNRSENPEKEREPYEYFATPVEPFRFSWDSKVFLRNLSLFHEICLCENGETALLTGASCRPAPNVIASVQWVNIPGKWNNSLAAKSLVSKDGLNQSCLKMNLLLNINRYVDLKLFTEQIHYRWLRYMTSSPSVKTSCQLLLSIKPSKTSQIDVFLKKNTDQVDIVEDSFIDSLGVSERNSTGVLCKINPVEAINFKLSVRTVETHYPGNKKGNGWLIAQDVSCRAVKKKVTLSGHCAFFQTDTYNERLYIWEADVYKGFSIPVYYDQGYHISGMVQARITKILTFCAKYSVFKYPGHKTTGSGENVTQGDCKSQITMQMRFNL